MRKIVEEQLELSEPPISNVNKVQNHLFIHQTKRNNYSLKDELDELIGPSNFNYQLEIVNLAIGILISLLLFFFL
jgi:hypothetical protein